MWVQLTHQQRSYYKALYSNQVNTPPMPPLCTPPPPPPRAPLPNLVPAPLHPTVTLPPSPPTLPHCHRTGQHPNPVPHRARSTSSLRAHNLTASFNSLSAFLSDPKLLAGSHESMLIHACAPDTYSQASTLSPSSASVTPPLAWYSQGCTQVLESKLCNHAMHAALHMQMQMLLCGCRSELC